MNNFDYKNAKQITVKHEFTLKSNDNFVIAKYKLLDPANNFEPVVTITAMGENLPAGKMTYTFYGSFEYNQKYKNYTFKVKTYQLCVDDCRNIADFLSTSIKGCGKKTAKKITDTFKDKTLEVLRSEKAVEQLAKIRGISRRKAERIINSFKENDNSQILIDLVKDFGLSMDTAKKVFSKFEDESIETIKSNPYAVCNIDGIGFSTADDIATKIGFDFNSPMRVEAAITESLKRGLVNGNCYMQLSQLLNMTKSLCDRNPQMIIFSTGTLQKSVQAMVSNGLLKAFGGDKIYLKSINDVESRMARNVLSASKMNPSNISERIVRNAATTAFKSFAMTPSESQMQAVVTSMLNSFTVVTGGPGVGKTTVIKAIIETFRTIYGTDSEIVLAAPTGRAARRMTESCGYSSQTLHRLLCLRPMDIESDEVQMAREITADLLIVDEFSMCDIFIADHLFSAISGDTKVVVVGDVDQLPSVGPGLVLKNLIEAKEIATVRLTSVFRQSETSSIHLNAQKILQADTKLVEDKSFFFIPTDSEEITATKVIQSYKRLLSTHNNDVDNVQVLTPRREKVATSTAELNKQLQEIANPASPDKSQITFRGVVFRKGDKVMHVKKNGELISNGDIGRIVSITNEDGEYEVKVDFDSVEESYFPEQMEYLVHAYATTIHKSQGSEYDVVIIPLFDGDGSCQKLMNRNLIYTAITRAKEMVVIIGRRSDLNAAIMTKSDVQRNTLLKERIFNNALAMKPKSSRKFA